MKKLKIVIFVTVLIFMFGGCSKNGSVNQATDVNNEVIYNNEIMDHNDDENIKNISDIKWDDPSIEENKRKVVHYIVSALNESGMINSDYYFPSGENGQFQAMVINGIADFSDYQLDGDMNNDGQVDEKDIYAVIEGVAKNDTQVDADKNGTIDNDDIIFVMSKLLTEAVSFSFYSLEGESLEIDPILWEEAHRAPIDGQDDVLVVVNDCNGNNQLNLKSQRTQTNSKQAKLNLTTKAYAIENKYDAEITEILNTFMKRLDEEPDEYLISWFCVVKALENQTNTKDKTSSNTGLLTPYHQMLTDAFNNNVVNRHFSPYNMLTEPKIVEKEYSWSARAGMDTGIDMEGGESLTVELESYTYSDFDCHATNDGSKTKKIILTYTYNALTRPMLDYVEGDIYIEGWDSVNGELNLHRAGPGANQDEIEVTATLTNGKFKPEEPLPSGDIVMNFKCPHCGFEMTVSPDCVLYAPNGTHLWADIQETVTVVGKVVEATTDEGKENVTVTIKSDCEEMGNHFSGSTTTNAQGEYTFTNVPVGLYTVSYEKIEKQIMVNNPKQEEVEVPDIEIGATYDVRVVYKDYINQAEVKANWNEVNIDVDTERNWNGLYLYADGVMQMFNNQDSNGDGKIERSEFTEGPFDMMDFDKDGVILLNELTQTLDDMGGLWTIDPTEYEVTDEHEYLDSSFKKDESLPFGLTILGIKDSQLEGNSSTYEAGTVAVCWDIYYEVFNNKLKIKTEQPSATFLPISTDSSYMAFKSSIDESKFKDLIEKGIPIIESEQIKNTMGEGFLSEYTLEIKPHKK